MDILKLLTKGSTQVPTEVSIDSLRKAASSQQESDLLQAKGITTDILSKLMSENLILNSDRSAVYRQLESALAHPLISSAVSLFADTACNKSVVTGKSIWVDTENKEYKYQIEKLLDIINIDEVIYDWAWTSGFYGDLFVEAYGGPGIGITGIADDLHPISISRADFNGKLVGFFETPQGVIATERKLLPPWQFVHFRLLGAKKRRPLYADANYTEFRSISLMAPDIRRVNSKYGVSLANDALPIYRRLRLAEDSILMARITKGVLRYIYKVGVGDTTNSGAIQALIDNYVDVLKQARNLNLDTNDPRWNAKSNQLATNEDIILPVWGDVNSLQIEKIGGETDIRWIVDVDELRNQLACALKTPLTLLGGYQKEATGPLGGNSAERLDIRFARQVRRLQSTLINGVTRLAQIHLAYQGMSPDLNLFKIRMAEVSTAEELEAQKGLSEAADTVDKVTDLIMKHTGERIDKIELLNYFNQKLLKLDDLDLKQMIKDAKRVGPQTSIELQKEEGKDNKPAGGGEPNPFRESRLIIENSDLKAPIPEDIIENGDKLSRTNKIWESEYRNVTVKIEEMKQ